MLPRPLFLATGGAELTSLASMARVTRSVSSLMGTLFMKSEFIVCDGVGIALSDIPLLLNLQPGRCLGHSGDRPRWSAGLPLMEILWVWWEIRIE